MIAFLTRPDVFIALLVLSLLAVAKIARLLAEGGDSDA